LPLLTYPQAWRQDKVEVAEHMYKKAALSDNALDPDTAEDLANLLKVH
jgi:hypothetical protein